MSLRVATPTRTVPVHFAGGWWSSGNASVLMEYADTSICYLDLVQGKFRGGGEAVRLSREIEASTGRPRWRLSTSRGSASDHVQGEASCFWFWQWDV
jgi:hypothetical protein